MVVLDRFVFFAFFDVALLIFDGQLSGFESKRGIGARIYVIGIGNFLLRYRA